MKKSQKTIKTEDRLREEYFILLPEIISVAESLETEINYYLLDLKKKLKLNKKIIVTSRVKECESAIHSLKRRQEGLVFDPAKKYTLKDLKDLAGVRISVFPSSLIPEVDEQLKKKYKNWKPDPLEATESLMFPKYHFKKGNHIQAEYQIVPLLIDLFWKVEHSALYKPDPKLKGVSGSLKMKELRKNVYQALHEFDQGFEEVLKQA